MRTYCIALGTLLSALGNLNEKDLQKEGVYVYAWLIHFAVQQKLTQHYIKQLYSNKKLIIKRHTRELASSDSSLCHMRAQQEDGCLQTRKRVLSRTSLCWHPDFKLPGFQDCKKQMSALSHLVHGNLL